MEWGLTPSQFDSQSSNDKAEMMAYCQVKNGVESYHHHKATAAAEMNK